MNVAQTYFRDMAAVLLNLPVEEITRTIEVLGRARDEGRRVFVFGNGGSAATASHFVCDLVKGTSRRRGPRFKAFALNDNIPTFSAYANDVGYEKVFAEQLLALADAEDVAIGVSASGRSPNVLQAMDTARHRGLITIGLTGFQGGELKNKVDTSIIVPSDSMQLIEDAHLVILHAVFLALCQEV